MKQLLIQLIKFGFVGGLCFLIDFGLYTACNYVGVPYLISGIIGFSVSVIINYVLSMRYVFKGRDNLSKHKEFFIFIVLSVIGLGLNELLLYLCVDHFYLKSNWAHGLMNQRVAETISKLLATVLVMIYNFVTRKVLLEENK